jgi:hypothetical protein
MQRIDPVEIVSGLLILAFGAFFFIGAAEYPMGTINRMGPGFIPRSLGGISMGLGFLICLGSLRASGGLPHVSWRAVASITASISIFGLLIERLGLVPAVLAASALSMLGNIDATWRQIIVTSASIALICFVLFIVLLGLPIPALWTDT